MYFCGSTVQLISYVAICYVNSNYNLQYIGSVVVLWKLYVCYVVDFMISV